MAGKGWRGEAPRHPCSPQPWHDSPVWRGTGAPAPRQQGWPCPGCGLRSANEGGGGRGQPARRHLRLHRARTYRPWQRWCPRLTSRLRGWDEDESGCDRNESISPACVDQRFLSVGGGTSGEMCSGGHITGGLSSLAVAPPARALALLPTKEPQSWHGYERQMPRVGNPEPMR